MVQSNMIKASLSYWERVSFFEGIDVVIIGSGIVGLNAALTLKEKDNNLRVVVLERGPLPIGASTRNAGFACFGSLSELLEDLAHHSEEDVLALVAKRWRGLQRLKERIGAEGLDYQEWGGYEIFRKEDQQQYEDCREKLSHFNQALESIIGRKNIYQLCDQKIQEFGLKNVDHLIWNHAEGQIDTGKMMLNLLNLAKSKGIEIINGLGVKAIDPSSNEVVLHTENGWELKAQKVLIATNGFAQQLLSDIDLQPARNQVLITHPIQNLKVKGCFHYDGGYFYFRNIHNRILLGGGRNLALDEEQTATFGTTNLIQNALVELLENVILPDQDIKIDSWWSGILGVGVQKQPLIKKISDRVVIAVRMGGMGVAIGSLVGAEGAELIVK